ncbi:tetratricopeptide repeat protein [Burkholderia pseudomultivorans]|uniref:tetratricopeptide repeat protein n=1 Tax=Burkholderia pseudomultivorans TaxID=1207504 RepID=UPI00188E7E14|nr:tetratricopeptide repeat protein [Burkholderia pseudomultivorans]MBF5009322.1 tetratricopeptide repeat protein [Burkholderia pseudomultivorans]
MKDRLFAKLSGVVLACGVIAGCATQPTPPTADVFNKSLADADAVAKSGDQDKALGLYQQLAKSDPTREEPWSRIAQIQFTQNHYGQAIVAAQEALQRDATDRQAKSVLAVAGLRIATQSLGELRQDASLAGDAKSDAQALAKQLRETLGENALFPPEQKTQPKKWTRTKLHRPKVTARTEAADSGAATTPPPPPPVSSGTPQKGGDPFSALR